MAAAAAAGWGAAGAAAAGAVVGAGVAEASSADAYANGYAAASSSYSIGAIYPTIPSGCATPNVRGVTYELCGNNWYQPAYGANGVYYRAVPAP